MCASVPSTWSSAGETFGEAIRDAPVVVGGAKVAERRSLLLTAESGSCENALAPSGAREMSSVKLTPKEIVDRLQIVESLIAEGRPMEEALRWAGMTEVAYERWRIEYGGLLRILSPLRFASSTLPNRKRRSRPSS
jgi:hypothetical protein